ncbi:MAG: hypothetical protein ACKVP2_08345 [Burkholderiales bacterium]
MKTFENPVLRHALLLAALLLAVHGCGGGGGGGGGNPPATTSTYSSVINGLPVTAVATLEPLITHTVMSGQILNVNVVLYTFTADLVGSSGFGTLVETATLLRSSIFIELTATGFILTNNVLPDPGPPTSYVFTRV